MHDYNLFADIKKLLIESHTKEEIKALSTSELKKLHAEYMEKGTEEDKAEAAEIKKEIDSRGEDGEEKLEEATRGGWGTKRANKILGDNQRAADAVRSKGPKEETNGERLNRLAREEMAKKKSHVAEQNEELLAILDVLCEMAGLDMEVLVEETRKEMENLGRAYSWDKPAPPGAPHGRLAANARDVIVGANRLKGTRGERAAREREEFRVGSKFAKRVADEGPDFIHNPETGGVVRDVGKFDAIQNDIDEIGRQVSNVENERKMSPEMLAHLTNLRRLAKPAAKKPKGMRKFGFEIAAEGTPKPKNPKAPKGKKKK